MAHDYYKFNGRVFCEKKNYIRVFATKNVMTAKRGECTVNTCKIYMSCLSIRLGFKFDTTVANYF